MTVETRRRPPGRRTHILAAAAQRFRAEGYDRVSMADIAADVGIGPSALYRHVRGKRELLSTVLDEGLRALEALDGDLPARLAEHTLRHRVFGELWQREAGHLPAEERRALRHRLRGLAGRVAAGLPEPTDRRDLRSWAVLSVLDSPSHHRTDLDPARHAAILGAAVAAVTTIALPADGPVLPDPTAVGVAPVSRREALLAAAARLFADHGYPSVGLDDIGAAAGISGPSVYHHFPGKAELLVATLHRGDEALWFGLHAALRGAVPADALERVLDQHVRFATENPAVVGALLTEVAHLPDGPRAALRRTQRDYVVEWVALLRRAHPELPEIEARVRVHVAFALVNSLSRIHHLRVAPGHAARTATLARAVLTVSGC